MMFTVPAFFLVIAAIINIFFIAELITSLSCHAFVVFLVLVVFKDDNKKEEKTGYMIYSSGAEKCLCSVREEKKRMLKTKDK